MKNLKKQNPYAKRTIIQARVDNEDMQIITTKAFAYCEGNMGEFIRRACLEYKPLNTKKTSAK